MVEAHRLLSEAPGIEFAGNVEGGDIPAATVDVVVTDGFTGNVTLKVMEGSARAIAGAIGDAARSNPVAAVGGLLLKPALGGMRREFHPDTTGGAILLGLRGIAVVGHGSSGAEGIANAVRLAARCAEVDAVGRTAALLREGGASRSALAEDDRGEHAAAAAEALGARRHSRPRDEPRRTSSPWSASTSPRSSKSTSAGSPRRPASARTSTPTRSTSTSW